MANIKFLEDERDERNGPFVSFSAVVDGRYIACVIRYDAALRDHFGATYYDLLTPFRANRKRIEQVAEKLIMQDRFECDGTILIKSQDI